MNAVKCYIPSMRRKMSGKSIDTGRLVIQWLLNRDYLLSLSPPQDCYGEDLS